MRRVRGRRVWLVRVHIGACAVQRVSISWSRLCVTFALFSHFSPHLSSLLPALDLPGCLSLRCLCLYSPCQSLSSLSLSPSRRQETQAIVNGSFFQHNNKCGFGFGFRGENRKPKTKTGAIISTPTRANSGLRPKTPRSKIPTGSFKRASECTPHDTHEEKPKAEVFYYEVFYYKYKRL